MYWYKMCNNNNARKNQVTPKERKYIWYWAEPKESLGYKNNKVFQFQEKFGKKFYFITLLIQ